MKVLHYKTNFLNRSETFIDRLLRNHNHYQPVGMCINKKYYTDHLPVYQKPQSGISGFLNTICFHLNLSLPFYKDVIENVVPDIIHAHFGFDGYRMYGVAQKTNTPLLVSFHGSDVSRLPSEFDWKRRYKNLAQKADGFTAISKLMKKELVDLGFPKQKIEVVRTGIELNDFTYRSDFNPDEHLMMAGRMVEKKGFKYALKAVDILKKSGTNINLDLYGGGPLKNDLQQMAHDLGIEQQVHFYGFVSNEQIRKELQRHCILLAPSVTASDGDKEGLPVTILEAMASGIPVIASDHSAISEVVINNHTGILVEERDVNAIANSIKKILDKKISVDKMKQNGRELIEKQHSIEKVVSNTENTYDKIINARK